LPKVFADVPSTAELKAAEDAAAKAKSASGMLTIVAVLMAGALIAVAAFLVITLGGQSKAIQAAKDTAATDVKTAQTAQKDAEVNSTALRTDVSNLKPSSQPVQPVVDMDKQVSDELTSIKSKLDLPAYSGVRKAIPAEAWLPYDGFKWTAFDGSNWQTYVLTN